MEWTPQHEEAAQRLLSKLQKEPLASERQEFGRFLLRHINDLTAEERKRYDELEAILIKS